MITRSTAEGITLLLWTLGQVCGYEIRARDVLNRIKITFFSITSGQELWVVLMKFIHTNG